jgi:hypothetical protein
MSMAEGNVRKREFIEDAMGFCGLCFSGLSRCASSKILVVSIVLLVRRVYWESVRASHVD